MLALLQGRIPGPCQQHLEPNLQATLCSSATIYFEEIENPELMVQEIEAKLVIFLFSEFSASSVFAIVLK